MSMTWVPERAGQLAHALPHLRARGAGSRLSIPGRHASRTSRRRRGCIQWRCPGSSSAFTSRRAPATSRRAVGARDARCAWYIRHLPFLVDSSPAISVAFGDSATFGHATGRHDVPVPTLYLTRDEPVRIWVVNHLPTPTAVHWHGIELESYYDGVPGWSGWGKQLEPMIAPGDSFAVYMTPPRAGTFIYHSHMENGHDLAAGLYGALIVQDPAGARHHARARRSLFGGGDPPRDRSLYLNGSLTPPPRALTVGVTYRVRVVDIAENLSVMGVLTFRARPVKWRRVAKDGADLPDAGRTVVRRRVSSRTVGETYDYEFTPTQPGDYFLEIVRGTRRREPPALARQPAEAALALHAHERVVARALLEEQVPPGEHRVDADAPLLGAELPPVHREPALLEQPPRRALARRQLRAHEQLERSKRPSAGAAISTKGTSAASAASAAGESDAASPFPKSSAETSIAARAASAPCTRSVTSRASACCASRFSGRSRDRLLERLDLRARHEREETEEAPRVPVVGVHPVLVEAVGTRDLRVEVHRPRFRLPELRAARRRHQRQRQRVRLVPVHRPDQLDPRGDVPPLVAAADLQRAPLAPVQLQVVVRLQQHVAELGVRDAALQPRLHRVLLQHVVDR